MRETVNARKERLDISGVMELLSRVTSISTANRSKIAHLEWEGAVPEANEISSFTLGPSGFLRAPTVIFRNKMFVGFSKDLYEQLLA